MRIVWPKLTMGGAALRFSAASPTLGVAHLEKTIKTGSSSTLYREIAWCIELASTSMSSLQASCMTFLWQ